MDEGLVPTPHPRIRAKFYPAVDRNKGDDAAGSLELFKVVESLCVISSIVGRFLEALL